MDHNKHCSNLLEYLSSYIDGELEDQKLCSEIESHLENCENCQIMVDTLKKTLYLYQAQAKNAPLPSDVRTRLFVKLELDKYLDQDQLS
jgi:predicted anti-sigma-YlaC factor YlaD